MTSNIGIIDEPSHKESWIIAMDCKPSKYKVLDYGMRWGIEAMFSDFKSRGFCITQTQLHHEDRIAKSNPNINNSNLLGSFDSHKTKDKT